MSPPRHYIAIAMLGVMASSVSAQEPVDPFDPFAPASVKKDRKVSVLIEWIQLESRAANKLIRKHSGKASAAEFRTELESLLDAGDAELVETAYIQTQSGRRAHLNSADEITYPSGVGLLRIPEKIGEIPVTLGHPPVFDQRDAGTTVEVDPVISHDGKTIDLSIAADIVEYLGDRHHPDPKNPGSTIPEAAFYSIMLNTSLEAEDGVVQFAGLLTPNPKKHPGKRLLVFIQADILR